MRKNLVVAMGMALAAQLAFADDSWFCKEVSSQRAGNVIKSCGVGNGSDENAARAAAFENAKKEFGSVCTLSTDCRGRAISVTPERTTCEKEGAGYKCYRLIVFTIGNTVDDGATLAATGAAPGAMTPESSPTPASEATHLPDPLAKFEPIDIDQTESFKPFYYRDIASLPKIKVGMTKTKALAKFGKPSSVRESGGSVIVFYRERPFCEGERCSFRFDEKTGKVLSFADFKFEYTEVLK